jgi:hypothetical protein
MYVWMKREVKEGAKTFDEYFAQCTGKHWTEVLDSSADYTLLIDEAQSIYENYASDFWFRVKGIAAGTAISSSGPSSSGPSSSDPSSSGPSSSDPSSSGPSFPTTSASTTVPNADATTTTVPSAGSTLTGVRIILFAIYGDTVQTTIKNSRGTLFTPNKIC